MNPEYFLSKCIDLAVHHMEKGHGGPFGAIVVKENKIISEGFNAVTSTFDPTAHAEVQAIRKACAHLNDFQLTNCELYTSCEPCPMCLGAIYWARPSRVYFAATRFDAAKAGFDDELIYKEIPLHFEKRQIPFIHLELVESNKPFARWLEKTDKTAY